MEFSAKQIASLINGTIDGNPEARVNRISKIEEGQPGSMTFLANPLYTQYIYTTAASIILVNTSFKPEKPVSGTLIRVDDPYAAFAKLLEVYHATIRQKEGISESAAISPSARIGRHVYIGPFVSIGEDAVVGDHAEIHSHVFIGDRAMIGEHSVLHAGVKVYRDCVIGRHCIIHAGVVIGADGFGFAPQDTLEYKKVIQAGNVILEDYVEVGANTTIDRATLGSTIIRKGVKLDNLIQIAHNVEIGENTVIAAQTGISGSTKIGRNCMIGGQVGIIGHLTIADNVKIAAQSGIGNSIMEAGAIVQGSPAFEIAPYRKSYIHFRNLDRIVKKIRDIEKRIEKKE